MKFDSGQNYNVSSLSNQLLIFRWCLLTYIVSHHYSVALQLKSRTLSIL